MKTVILATFVGEDGSLGYHTGRRYRLVLAEGSSTQGEYPLWICRLGRGRPGYCPYASINAFLRNWTNIVRLEGPK